MSTMDDWITILEHFTALIAILIGCAWVWNRLLHKNDGVDKKNDALKPPKTLIKAYLQNFSLSSNGIYHLYGSMEHFFVKPSADGAGSSENLPGMIGYKNVGNTTLMLTDPLCPRSNLREAIGQFITFCKDQKCDALLLAVNQETANEAKRLGYKLLKIGKEPIFDLTSYDPESLPSKLKSSIRQVTKKGVVIEELSLAAIFSPKITTQLNELLEKWFMTRGSDAFRLLTEVAPVKSAEDKKFFVARTNDSIEGLLVCSKIFGRNGYFLHDLIRAPFSVNGVTDALVIHALKSFKNEGYEMASLGISPLAGVDIDRSDPDFPRTTRFLKWTFENMNSTYRFKELYHFKKKFLPSTEETAYLAVPKSGLKLRYVFAILSMFSDLNLFRQALFLLKKWKMGYNIPKPLARVLHPDKILLPPMSSFDLETVFYRLKLTIIMAFLNIYTFIYTTDLKGQIDPSILQQHGFSFQNFIENSWFILVTSNFVHFNYTHLVVNIAGMLLFSGSLEILGGSTLATIVYMFGMQANIPTGLILLPMLQWMSPLLFNETKSYIDVGASLAVMSTFGGLIFLMKPKIRIGLVAISCIGFTAYAFLSKELIGVDHAFAVICGMAITAAYFKFQPSQSVFNNTDIRFFERRKRTNGSEAIKAPTIVAPGTSPQPQHRHKNAA